MKVKLERIPHGSRTKCRVIGSVLAVLAILLIGQPAVGSAGMVLQEKTELVGGPAKQGRGPEGSQTRESTTYLQGKRIRTETEGRVWVLDFEKGLLVTINTTAKTYTEMSLDDLKEAQEQAIKWMDTLRAQMEERMKAMPPEQKAAMQKKLDSLPQGMSGDAKPVKITVKATGEEKKINGYPCKAYDVYEDGELTTQYWLAPSIATEVFDAYQRQLSKWLEGMGPLGVNRLQEWEHIQGKGFPIKVTRLKPIAGKVVFNREILKVEEKSLSESLFQPPKDYTRTEAPAFPKPGAQPGKMPKPK
jgi:hypothetical protein